MKKIIAFSGGCHSGKTTTMLHVKHRLESMGHNVIMLDEIARRRNITSIDDLRKKPSTYLAFQEDIVREKIKLEMKAWHEDLSNDLFAQNCDTFILVDRAISDSLFYMTFYLDPSHLASQRISDFADLHSEVNSHALFAFSHIYDVVFEFSPILGVTQADSLRPSNLELLQYSEYKLISAYNHYFNSVTGSKCQLVEVDVTQKDVSFFTDIITRHVKN